MKVKRPYKRWSLALLALLALAVLPAFAPQYVVHIVNFVFIYTLPVIGLGFLTGFTGRVSLAQGALFGVGAYTTALLTTGFGWSPIATLAPAILVTVLLAVTLGGAAVRLAGLYFVMATIGIQQIVWIVLMNWIDLTNGPQGVRSIPPVSIGGHAFETTHQFYFLALAFAAVSYVLAKRIIASRLGLFLRALSDDQLAASSVAVDVNRAKVTALALSAAWAGAGGFLYAHYVRYIHPDMFGLEPSVLFLVMSMFGGYRSLEGMIFATAVLESATEYLRPFGEFRMIVYGLILLLGMMYFPKGILTLVQRRGTKAQAGEGTQ
ncbi:branched-chain amino acid ABC transporter permease [Burkholderiaceae bacterium FT117]|uniref:branched-chain amino acid ABC transporter permease n=1 Tax=Zeimonas sediminis TaxID=2944268 RepID=UPI002342D209|nr:branched-chain amino acid ABC transporter permease [Zeimonas sediminis]MCM5570444.1 branched-chain amino acid ABC transporter permease [Zeimonas sediminis]